MFGCVVCGVGMYYRNFYLVNSTDLGDTTSAVYDVCKAEAQWTGRSNSSDTEPEMDLNSTESAPEVHQKSTASEPEKTES